METKILIGTLADIFGISKQTLIYYDKIGLLTPLDSLNNNYRYYTYEHFNSLDLILSLKDTGMSLTEIKSYLENRTLNQSVNLLQQQTLKIEEHIAHLKHTQRKLSKRLSRMNDLMNSSLEKGFRIIKFEERYILKIPFDIALDHSLSLGDAFKRLNTYIKSDPELVLYAHLPTCFSPRKESIQNYDYHDINFIFKELEVNTVAINCDTIAENTYICLNHYGHYEDLGITYERILSHLKLNNYEIIGDILEIPKVDVWSVSNESEFVIEIQIPIKTLS